MAHEALGNLSEREREVLYLIATRQMTNRQVAERLNVEESTVATHVHHILKTTHTHNRHEAARLWLDDYGLDPPPEMGKGSQRSTTTVERCARTVAGVR